MLDSTEPTYGEFEGEAVDHGRVVLKGGGHLLRKLVEGEPIVLVVEGSAGLPRFERDAKSLALVRVDTVNVRTMGEPGPEDMADEAEAFLARITEAEAEAAQRERDGADPNQGRLEIDDSGQADDDEGDDGQGDGRTGPDT